MPTTGALGHDRDLQHEPSSSGRPMPEQHEELRRQVGAAADDDLALGAVLEQLAEPRPGDADRARPLEAGCFSASTWSAR